MQSEMIRFAGSHLAPYRVRGDELIPDYCPFCRGGESKDRYTFALNLTDGVYVCKRGGCGVRGRYEELAAHFGEQSAINRPVSSKTRHQYTIPDTELLPLTDEIIRYFDSRRISRDTLDAFQISADKNGDIVFPFFRDGVRLFDKYRHPRKPQPRDRKEWQFSGAQPILFGMDLCSFAQP